MRPTTTIYYVDGIHSVERVGGGSFVKISYYSLVRPAGWPVEQRVQPVSLILPAAAVPATAAEWLRRQEWRDRLHA